MHVNVLMPVFNAAMHLPAAIESVLNQTHRDFILFLINDGSTDDSLAIMQRYAQQDNRIRIINHENCGMGESLNKALRIASSDWVMRMDGDDLMLPDRLTRQIAFIQANPDVKVTACLAQYISDAGQTLGKTTGDLVSREKFCWYVENNEVIGLLHPGVAMHRKTILNAGGYRGQFWPADDIDLWNRLAEQGHLIMVQPEVLLQYRVHAQSAITSHFKQGRLKYEWVRACLRARRTGCSEPTWSEFETTWNQASWWVQLNRARKLQAKFLYRQAGYDKLMNKTGKAILNMMMATCLQPGYTLKRLLSNCSR